MEHTTKDSHNLAFDTVLLGGKGEGAVHSSVKLGKAADQDVREMEGTNFDLNILEAKGMFRIPYSFSIFAQAK